MCDYIGSKFKLRNWISGKILSAVGKDSLNGYQFIDACSGSGWISRMAAGLGADVVSCDLLLMSKQMIDGSIGITEKTKASARLVIDNLNKMDPVKGFFYNNYSPAGNRKYLTENNASKLDAMIDEIEEISNYKLKMYLKYCLLESFSRVMNTSGHTVSFHDKGFKDRAKRDIELRMESTYEGKVTAMQGDVSTLLPSIKDKSANGRIFYMDPPYNVRQYGNNYHLYETIARNDKPDIPSAETSGKKCGYRDWQNESRSNFCSKEQAAELMAETVLKANPTVAFISYNSDSIVSPAEMSKAMRKVGFSTRLHETDVKRYNADSKNVKNNKPLKEYLFEMRKI